MRPIWMGPKTVDEAVKSWTAKFRLVFQDGRYRIDAIDTKMPVVELDPVFSGPSLPEWSRSMVKIQDAEFLGIEPAPRDPCFRCYTGDFDTVHTCKDGK